jgi:hypothetical protein
MPGGFLFGSKQQSANSNQQTAKSEQQTGSPAGTCSVCWLFADCCLLITVYYFLLPVKGIGGESCKLMVPSI